MQGTSGEGGLQPRLAHPLGPRLREVGLGRAAWPLRSGPQPTQEGPATQEPPRSRPGSPSGHASCQPSPPRRRWALCTEGTATLGGLLHLLSKGGPIAALKGELPPLRPQAPAAALARAGAPALHPRQRARGLADGIAPLDLVKVPDRVPPALRPWIGQTPRESLRAQLWAGAAHWGAAGGGGEERGRGASLEAL